jgi:RNA-binding protein YlmH
MKNRKPELKVYIGKRKINIKLTNIPLTDRARELTEEYIAKLSDELKLDNVIIEKANPYKTKPKTKKNEPKKEIKINYEEADKAFEELEKLFKSFEDK